LLIQFSHEPTNHNLIACIFDDQMKMLPGAIFLARINLILSGHLHPSVYEVCCKILTGSDTQVYFHRRTKPSVVSLRQSGPKCLLRLPMTTERRRHLLPSKNFLSPPTIEQPSLNTLLERHGQLFPNSPTRDSRPLCSEHAIHPRVTILELRPSRNGAIHW